MKAWLNKGEVGAAEMSRREPFRYLSLCLNDLIQLTVTLFLQPSSTAVCRLQGEVVGAGDRDCC